MSTYHVKPSLGSKAADKRGEFVHNTIGIVDPVVCASITGLQGGTIAMAIMAVNGEELSIEFQQLKKKFIRLKDEWKKQRRHESSTIKMVTLPAYQNIIGMGPAALPFLFWELENDLDIWFWALTAITEEDPVPEHVRGDGKAMALAWLDWARNNGIRW